MRLKFMAAIPALLAVPAVLAQSDSGAFTVGDIRIEGLQRISEGTVFNYRRSTSATASNAGSTRRCARLRRVFP
jgi:outer membrane protein assembly factor BamA